MIGRACILGVLGSLLWTCGAVHAHDSGIANVNLVETSSGQWLLESKTRAVDEPQAPQFPEGFTVFVEATRMEQGARVQGWLAQRDTSLKREEEILLPWAVGAAYVTAEWADGTSGSYFFTAGEHGITVQMALIGGSPGSVFDVVYNYVFLGVEHILSGWDHLAFVVAIFLMSRGRGLVRLITGFTVGHSFTLGAAAVGWVHIPSPPVEAAIALSIALVAAQSLGKQDSVKHGFWVVFGFGLLHGLGFAGALSEIGLPKGELITGLLSFNIGVEIGQLIFVAVIVLLAYAGRALAKSVDRPIPVWARAAPACVLIAIGSFWTLERVLGFAA